MHKKLSLRLSYLMSLCILLSNTANAQKSKGLWQFNITPTLGNRIITYKENVSTQFKDSIKKADGWRSSIGAGIGYSLVFSKTTRLTIGVQYQNLGFTRSKENLNFGDTIHPEIGKVQDLSQVGSKYIDFNYRYHYLAIPILFNYQFSENKAKTTSFHWVIGGSVAGLVKYDIRAVLHGFSAFGEKVFILKNEPEQPGLFNINFHTGIRLENLVYGKNTRIFVQPMFYAPILAANYGKERHRLFALGLELGLTFKVEKSKTEL